MYSVSMTTVISHVRYWLIIQVQLPVESKGKLMKRDHCWPIIVGDQVVSASTSRAKIIHEDTTENNSPTYWTAWPAVGRSTLHVSRSAAAVHSASAVIPESSSTWRTHVFLGRPCCRFHVGLKSTRRPTRASIHRPSAAWAGTVFESRRTCPNSASRRLCSLLVRRCSLHVFDR